MDHTGGMGGLHRFVDGERTTGEPLGQILARRSTSPIFSIRPVVEQLLSGLDRHSVVPPVEPGPELSAGMRIDDKRIARGDRLSNHLVQYKNSIISV